MPQRVKARLMRLAFLRSALRENGIDPETVKIVAISSVVPELNYTLGPAAKNISH